MIGQVLHSCYQINKKLGTGGFGSTYIATNLETNQECVVKKLQPITTETKFLQQARRLFKKEANTLKTLNHNQIPRFFDYFEEDKEFYLVQEYVKGDTLTQELKPNQIWEEKKVIAFLKDGLNILNYIHKQGIIHRDIKPDNFIRRQKDGKLVLIDFGTVKEFNIDKSQVISQTIAVGTRGYMPLEQLKGKPQKSSDIYALGIIAIQAITGFNPMQLEEDDTGELIWLTHSNVSDFLASIITKMVKNYHQKRYHSTSEILEDLKKLSSQNTLENSQSSLNSPPAKTQIVTPDINQNLNPPHSHPQATQIDNESSSLSSSNNQSVKSNLFAQLNTFFKSPSPLKLSLIITISLAFLISLIMIIFNVINSKNIAKQREELITKLDTLFEDNKYQECFTEAESKLANKLLSQEKKIDYIGKCRLESAQEKFNDKNYAQSGAIAIKITSNSSYYEQAQVLIKDGSQRIFKEAEKIYTQQGKLIEALAKINTIVDDRAKQSYLIIGKDWEEETERNEHLVEEANKELNNKNWQQAINIADTIYGAYFWEKEAQNIIKKAKKGMRGGNILPDIESLCDDPNQAILGNCD